MAKNNKGNSKSKKDKSALDHASRKARKKGDYVASDNLIPEHFDVAIDPKKANRAQRRLIKRLDRKKGNK